MNGRGVTQSLAMDGWQGKGNSIQTVFTTFDESEMSWLWKGLTEVWEHGHKIPMITWEPKYWQQWSPTDITKQVASGSMDSYVITWGQGLKDYISGADGVLGTDDDRRAYLRFAHEMNGNWYPWSAASGPTSPSHYVDMWKHVYELFDSDQVGLSRSKCSNSLLWVWSPINFDVGDFKMDDYYPGHSYVDWVGITGFNWGTSEGWSGWWTPTQLFQEPIDRVRAIGGDKPVAITEYSSVPDGGDKSAWLNEFFNLVQENDVRMACYFNLDKFEQSGMKYWSIFGGGGDENYWDSNRDWRGWAAYKEGVNQRGIIGADYNNPRVISDDAFKGGSSHVRTLAVREVESSNSSNESEEKSGSHESGSTPRFLKVFDDKALESFDFESWGSDNTITNPNFVPKPSSVLGKAIPEGKKVLLVNTTQWGGCGIFTRPDAGPISLTSYKRLRFSIANTREVLVELQDATGRKWSKKVTGTSELNWRKVTFPLSEAAKSVDLSRMVGLFLVSTHTATDFYVDKVTMEK